MTEIAQLEHKRCAVCSRSLGGPGPDPKGEALKAEGRKCVQEPVKQQCGNQRSVRSPAWKLLHRREGV